MSIAEITGKNDSAYQNPKKVLQIVFSFIAKQRGSSEPHYLQISTFSDSHEQL